MAGWKFLAASPGPLNFRAVEVHAKHSSVMCNPREAMPAVSWRWSRASLRGETQPRGPPCCSKLCMKGVKDKVLLTGAWRGLTDRLPCPGAGFHLKCYLWASPGGFPSFLICRTSSYYCYLHLSGLRIREVSLQSPGAQVVWLPRVVGKSISSSSFSNFLCVICSLLFFQISLSAAPAMAPKQNFIPFRSAAQTEY